MAKRLAKFFLIAMLCASAAACSLFGHDKSPQQQYTEALMRGNSMQATQLWLTMSPEDKMKFGHGEGFAPDGSSQDEVKRQIMNHVDDQTIEGPSGGSGGSGEEVQQSIPTPLGASLQSLPGISGSTSGPAPGSASPEN